MVSVVKNRKDLKKRILRFFDEKSARSAVHHFLNRVSEHVDLYIYGGLIRDIALNGVASFKSDIDLVYVGDSERIALLLNQYLAEKNRFGGYRLTVDEWQIDIWEAPKTWAFKKGYMQYKDITSLLRTTITNWDSVLFDWNSKSLICEDSYFQALGNRYLDIVFEENPNEIGMIVRLIRYYTTKNAHHLSPKAASLIRRGVDKFTYEDLSNYEFSSYGKSYISRSIYQYLKENESILNPDLLPIELDEFHQTKPLL